MANVTSGQGRKPIRTTRLVELIVLAMLIIGGIGTVVGRLATARSRPAIVDPFPKDNWARRSVGGLSLDAPFEFRRDDVSVPQLILDTMQVYEMSSNVNATNRDVTYVLRTVYKPESIRSVEDVADGTMRAGITCATKENPSELVYRSGSLTIDGLHAIRTSYSGEANGVPQFVEGLFIQNGPEVWTVHVIFHEAEYLSNATRIIDSVHIGR